MQLSDRGTVVPHCGTCGTELHATVSDFTATPVADGRTNAPSTFATTVPRSFERPTDLLGSIRARLVEVRAEVARLEGLKVEQKQLTKMLAVADRVAVKRRQMVNGHVVLPPMSEAPVVITTKN